jgi:hypothetical protein
MEYKAFLNILNPIRMPPTTLAEDSLDDHHQSCASRVHIPPLSSGRRSAQVVIQCEILLITCRKGEQFVLLNIISFRQFQIAQTKAQTPIVIRALADLSIPFSQFPNIFFILLGGGILKVK